MDDDGRADANQQVLIFRQVPQGALVGKPFDRVKSGAGHHYGTGGAFGNTDAITWERK